MPLFGGGGNYVLLVVLLVLSIQLASAYLYSMYYITIYHPF